MPYAKIRSLRPHPSRDRFSTTRRSGFSSVFTSPLTRWLGLARFCVMREDRKRANVSRAGGLPTREFPRCATLASKAYVRDRRRSATSLPRATLARVRDGFAASEDASMAVCVLPGTELSFVREVRCFPTGLLGWRDKVINHKTAIFRQINKEKAMAHHDALEFPDGEIALLTFLCEGQQASVLQLPAEQKTAIESEAQQRAATVG
jgi:hypothetical protein